MKGGVVGIKQEMTKLWVDAKFVPVTLIKLAHQEVVRYKTAEKDGYDAVVVGVNKKVLEKERGKKVMYEYVCEFSCDEELKSSYGSATPLTLSLLDDKGVVRVSGISKGKGFQGGIKKHNFAGGPATHGSKFHRALGSTGNRKPRRTHKGHPMAGRMGGEKKTHRLVSVISSRTQGGDQIVAIKGSLPGARNSYLKISIV